MENQIMTTSPNAVTTGVENYKSLWNLAKQFSNSDLVPNHFKGEKNVANCALALDYAFRMNANPLMIFQNMYVVYGNPAWSSKFLIATFNQSGRFAPITYQYQGTPYKDDYGCRAISAILSTGERIEGPLVTIGMAKAEGWYEKNGSKWKTLPDLMLSYRAGAFLVRTTAPEIGMGFQTVEEVQDVGPVDVTPTTEQVKEEIAAKTASTVIQDITVEPEPPKATPRPQPVVEPVAEPVKAQTSAAQRKNFTSNVPF